MSLNINSFNSDSVSTLFSSLSYKKSSSYTGLESILGDYSTIKTGSYGKLLKSYYSKVENNGSVSSKSDEQSTELSSLKNDSQAVSDSAEKLLAKGSKSLWSKVTSEDANGNKTTDYDRDSIYNAISDFVDNYNKLVDDGKDASGTGVLTQISSMVTTSSSAITTLAKVGITIDSKNHLSVDETYFKTKADMTAAKSLFNGTGSYVYNIATKASMVNSYASADLSKLTGKKSYTNTGNYAISTNDLISKFNTTT